MNKKLLTLTATLVATLTSALSAVTVLSSDFTGVSKSGNTASGFTWDAVNGITAPATSLSFVDPGNSNAALSFFNVTAGNIDVNENIGNGGEWLTSFSFTLDGSSTSAIALTTLDLNVTVLDGSGNPQSTASKGGTYTFTIDNGIGSASTSVNYPTTTAPSISLSSLGSLTTGTTYNVTLQVAEFGDSHGHHISLDSMTLSGDLTAVPEPSAFALLAGCFGLTWVMLRRRA